MTAFLLILVSMASFIFYGVVGQDKAWLLAPAFIAVHVLATVFLLKRAWCTARGARLPAPNSPASEATDNWHSANSGACNVSLPTASLPWLLFLLYGVAMVPLATVPFEAKLDILFIGAVIGAYLVWGGELVAFKDNRLALGFLIFTVMLCALYGLVVHFKNPDSILWTQRYTDHYEGRLASTYICPNHFAHLMQMMLPFCIALLFIPQAGIYLKILSAYSFLVFLPPLFETESRAGWLGSIAAVGVVLCLMALRRSKKLFWLLVILVPLCSVLLLAGAWRYSETFQRRMAPVVEFLEGQAKEGIGSDSPDFRPQTWMDTIDMIQEKPLVGFGPGNYRYTYPEHRKRFKGTRIVTGHPHNEYLELMADYGLVGFGLFAVAWLYGLVWVLIKSLKAEETRHAFIGFAFLGAAAGTMVHSFFDFQMHVFPNALVFALLAAVAVGPLQRDNVKKESLQTPNLKLQTVIFWLLAIGFLLLALLGLQTMSSAFIRAVGDKAFAMRQFEKAAALHRQAFKMDGSNWLAARGMGDVLDHRRRHSLDMAEKLELAAEERRWFEKAMELNGKDPETIRALGETLIFLGRKTDGSLEDRGLQLLREACDLRRFNDHYWWKLGVELRKSGRYGEAMDAFRHAQGIRRTPSTTKNIQWLEARLAQETRPAVENNAAGGSETGPDMPKADLSELLEKMAE